MTRPPPLENRFAARARRYLPEGEPVVVAVSGGLDSTVLLHLVRFRAGLEPVRLIVAHFDHRLRAGSAADARWVGGLARAWGLEFRQGAAHEVPSDEAHARSLRYAFLDGVREDHGARLLLTAHHADDQAETVLFRALRGTGVRGLRGMPTISPGTGRVRLLLPFWRRELERYAREAGLAWRVDPTNADLRRSRNVLRHDILPRAEAAVAPGARRALVRLARNAARDEAAWEAAEEVLLEPVLKERGEGRFVLALPGLLAYHPAVRSRLFRRLARALGVDPDEAGTRVAMEFTSRGSSGGEVHLAGGLVLRRSFDDLHLERRQGAASAPSSAALVIPRPGAGSAETTVSGRRLMVTWDRAPVPGGHGASFEAGALAFPLSLRAWRPGDKIRLRYGTKAVAKLLAEARVPRWEREERVVLVDAAGRVVWVPGVAQESSVAALPDGGDFHIGIENAHSE